MSEQMAGALPGGADGGRDEGPAWGWRDLFAALLTTIVAGGLLIIGIQAAAVMFQLSGDTLIAPAAYAAGVGAYLAVVLGVYLFGVRRAGWAALGLRPFSTRVAILIPMVFVLGLSGLVLVNLIQTTLIGEFENPQVDALTGGQLLGAGELAALMLLVAVLAPFAEELFFRGMLYPLMRRRLGPVLAIVLNALIFALIHFIDVLIPGLFVVGLAMAYLRERSGSIWPSVIFHMMQNSLALLAINSALSSGQL